MHREAECGRAVNGTQRSLADGSLLEPCAESACVHGQADRVQARGDERGRHLGSVDLLGIEA